MIHRGLIISFIEVFFIMTFYFVSIFLYNGYLTLGYSTIFTNLPVFALIWNIDIPLEQVYNYPVLYSLVQRGNDISLKVFFIWLWKSVFQAGTIFGLCILLIENSFVKIMTITFTSLIFIEFLNICSQIETWHRYIIYSLLLSVVLYVVSLFCLRKQFLLSVLTIQEFGWIMVITLVAWLPFQVFKTVKRRVLPDQVDKVIREAYIESQR